MSNKSLELLKQWIDDQRMSAERKYKLNELIDKAINEEDR